MSYPYFVLTSLSVPPTIHISKHQPPGGPYHHTAPPPAAAGSGIGSGKRDEAPKEELLLEIRRLRERIKTLEGDNATMHMSISKTQKDVNARLSEIELQIGDETTAGTSAATGDDLEDVDATADEEDDDDVALSCVSHGRGGEEGPETSSLEESVGDDEEKNRESFI